MSTYDVFISYSHDDADLGHAIHSALKAKNRRAWMDWTSIPLTAEWWKEITDGIKLADHFVFLISPASIASPVCNFEIEYARSLNKPIIPMLLKDTDEKTAHVELVHRELNDYQQFLLAKRDLLTMARNNWRALVKLNWVKHAAGEPLETTVAQLITALDTDVEYVREHTWLLTRADDWEQRGRLPSSLLQDDDLKRAETWLAKAKKAPEPTALQKDYVRESRTAEDKRVRRAAEDERRTQRLQWVSLVASVMVVLAIVALVLSGIRLGQVNAAVVAGEARTTSLDLASKAVEILSDLNGNREIAALLAIWALNTSYTLQADAALVKATDGLFAPQTLSGHTDIVTNATYSPDGDLIVTTSFDGKVRVWDAATAQTLRILNKEIKGFTSAVFSPDGQFIATTNTGITVLLFNTETGELIRKLNGHTDGVANANFSPSGQFLVTTSWDHTARIWDVTTGETDRILNGHFTYAIFSPDGKFIATTSFDGKTRIWDVTTGETVQILSGHTSDVISADYSPDGKFIVTASWDNTARIWDVTTGETVRILSGHTGSVNSAVYSPDGRFIVSASNDKTARVWFANYRDFMSYACTLISQDLTEAQRQQYGITDNTPTCSQFVTGSE